jgi:DNA-binding beta-propeller fold protein YncE
MAPVSLRSLWAALALLLFASGLAGAQTDFLTFESGQVRPLALTPSGNRLLAVNTPDNRLEVFDQAGGTLTHAFSVPVGMEPVAVAARTDTEIWVVNHLSDSVSIVDLAATPPRVTRTLLVGDEPRDILFAGTGCPLAGGTGCNRAFITTAHRGQHRTHSSISGVTGAGDPQFASEDVPRADVWVFDATALGTTIGGTPLRILTFFSDTPRALARNLAGDTVFVAAFHSGNRTTALFEAAVCNGFAGPCSIPGAPGGVAPPSTNAALAPAPEVGILLKFNGTQWRDTLDRNWTPFISFSLPDSDVFAVSANSPFTAGNVFPGVGTILFNMVFNAVTNRLYVTNTELPNNVRFEGPGNFGGTTVQGHLSETRITVINPSVSTSAAPKHLNKHINYANLHTDDLANHAAIDAQAQHSLATPLQMAVSSNGAKLYLAAFGSARIGVFDTADIEDTNFATNFDPTLESANYISTGGGPSGIVLDEVNNRLYVLTRFDNSVRVINPNTKVNLQTLPMTSPEPASVVTGRQFLYDAQVSSGNGEAACASCHIFGDNDDLAWDLGNPDDVVTDNNQPSTNTPDALTFHPMKGPMTTQTLRGLATHGGMHWRGDRVTGFFGEDSCTEPSGAPCNEDLSFRNFIVAFEGLLGKHGTITPTQMQQFTDFALQLTLPPNPVRNLDNSPTTAQANGAAHFDNNVNTDGIGDCNFCHTLDPSQGFFGSGGDESFEGEPQSFKIPHLRNAYTKIGMFGAPGDAGHGPQVRGFGFLHDGSVDTLRRFLGAAPPFVLTATQEQELEAFILAFPTDLAPIVGQQVTLTSTNSGVVGPRIDDFETRAGTPFTSLVLGGTVTECDVVVKGQVGTDPRGWRRESGTNPGNTIYRDDMNQTITGASLRLLATSDGPLTYTCAPPGSGTRMGIDQDRDLDFDGLDNCAAISNPGQENFDGDAQGNVCDSDDDNDGLLDTVETGTGVYVSPTNTGTNPLDTDSDDDARLDGIEVANGWDPNNPLSPGPAPVPALPLFGRLVLMACVLLAGLYWLRRRGTGTPTPA